MDDAITETDLSDPPWDAPRYRGIPGTLPLAPGDWLRVTAVHARQMALRDRLIARTPGTVIVALPGAAEGVAEMARLVLDALRAAPGYRVGPGAVLRPDGVPVPLDPVPPDLDGPERSLATLGRLVQEDLCLVEPRGGDHVLTAAVLCFPSHWTLDEKIGRPLDAVHAPVPAYDAEAARRVGRLFDGLRPGRPLWRVNGTLHAHAALHAPRREADAPDPRPATTFRSERQCLLRLPTTEGVVFSILTRQWRLADIPPDIRARL